MNAPLKKLLATPAAATAADCVAALDWMSLTQQLDGFGNAVIEGLLSLVHLDDVAEVAARVLMEDRHAGAKWSNPGRRPALCSLMVVHYKPIQ